jgi:hypothetical protein
LDPAPWTAVITALLAGLLAAVISVVGGYLVGVQASRNERRDAALAEIFKEMSLFYRYLYSWTDTANPDPQQLTAESESAGIPARKHVREQFNKFVLAFYGNAIWLGKGTYDLIEEFVQASRVFLNDLQHMSERAGVWRLPDGTDPKDRRKDQITPKFYKVWDTLRAELEASRYLIPYRIVIRRNGAGERRTDPGEGE